jgi:histidinol-phosphatase
MSREREVTADLELAAALADRADEITVARFGALDLRIDTKPDLTPVTDADEAVEAKVRALLARERPGDAIFGEEQGGTPIFAGRQWVIDPIDGTKNFVRGVPVWATMIGLVHADLGPVMGVVSAPALGMRWWGFVDGGAYFNGSPIQVSSVASLPEASLSITANSLWDKIGKTVNIDELTRAASRVRGYGDFWQHMLVAQGAVDVAVDAVGLEPYDIAALIPIVHGAGGMLTNRKGIVDWRANTAVSSNGLFHSDVIEILTRKN